MEQIARIYNVKDSYVIERGRVTVVEAGDNLAAFSAVDPSVDQNFLNLLTQLLNDAEATPSDEMVTDVQTQHTTEVKTVMKECRDYFGVVMYFVKKAFPDNKQVRNEFGENNYSKVRNDEGDLIIFMEHLHIVAQKYNQALLDVSMSQAQIDNILVLHDKLNQSNQTQDVYIDGRKTLTRERIIKLNTIWKYLAQISELAQIIYADNMAMMQMFLLPHNKSKNKDESVIIEASQTLVVMPENVSEETFVKIVNTGDTELKFYVADHALETVPENACTVVAKEEKIFKAEDISNDTFGKLISSNLTDKQGKFKTVLLQ